ncbi:MAG TPA: hypothetical protein VGG73_13470 [Vicinamibacterales bacterium]
MVWLLLAVGIGSQAAPPPATPEPPVPTAIEQAIAEYRCTAAQTAGTQAASVYDVCLSGQFDSLRGDFGRNLSRLSPGERRTIDTICNKVPASVDREAYVKCLSDQLVVLRNRRGPANPPTAAAAAAAATAPAAPSSDSALVPSVPASSAKTTPMVIGGTVVVLLAAGGAVGFALKSRRRSTKCRSCGQLVESGELCSKCRHDAAAALRQAALLRAQKEQAQQDEQRRQREHEEELARRRVAEREDAERRHEEQVRLEAETQREEIQRLQDAAVASDRKMREAELAESVFDPYAVLGIPRDATADAIRAAYEDARSKFSPDLVAGMSNELQEHFKARADAVERAFQALTTPA